MTVLDAFDYSWARPSPQQMVDAGIKVVFRYLFGPGKGIDDGELRALHAAGLGVGLGYEAERGNHLLGAGQGRIDGQAARGYAAGLGAPAGTPIYYACDLEVFPATMPTVLAYLAAADDVTYPARAYGQFSVIDRFARPGWQTLAWSGGQVSDRAVLYQWAIEQDFHGSAVDYNEIRDIEQLGAWWPAGSEHDMPSADEIAQAVWDQVLTDNSGTHQAASAWLKQSRNLSDPSNVIDAIKAELVDLPPGGLSKADVEAAVDAGVRRAFSRAGGKQ